MRSSPRRLCVLVALVAIGAGLSAQSTPITDLIRQADDALASGAWYEAVEQYRETLAINPNFTEALIGIAEAYYRLEEYDQARVFIERARRLARSDPRVLNLAGLIAIGRGDLAGAEEMFARVQSIEPNNVDAAVGRAELALARGQSAQATGFLERALRLHPNHRKALLSLVLVYEHQGEPEIARRYLDLARTVYRDRPEVQILAAEYFLRAGDYEEAARAARTAQAIDPLNRAAVSIRAHIALVQQSYLEAATIAEELIADDRSDAQAWFFRAVARYRTGELETALTSIRTALRIVPDNEMLRIWAEWLAVRELPFDDPVRVELAERRSADARLLEQNFRFDRALRAYRRALQLSPLDLGLRRRYAELFRRMGFNASYLQEIELLVDNGLDDEQLQRTIEVFTSALDNSVASAWGIDQFTVERTRTPIALYLSSVTTAAYPETDEALLDFVRRTLQSSPGVEIVHADAVSGYAQAFSGARGSRAALFLMLNIAANERLFALDGSLFVARTGSRAVELRAIRTGPDHAAAAVDAFAQGLLAALPVRGSLLRREGRRVVIDRGARDGIEAGAVFDVLDPADITMAASQPAYVYAPESVIATVTVTRVDDLVAEGELEIQGIVDLVTTGDSFVLRAEEGDGEPDDGAEGEGQSVDLFPILYERVRRLR